MSRLTQSKRQGKFAKLIRVKDHSSQLAMVEEQAGCDYLLSSQAADWLLHMERQLFAFPAVEKQI